MTSARRLLAAYYRQRRVRARAARSPAASGELKEVAAAFEKAGRSDEALEVLGEVADLDPADLEARASLGVATSGNGDLDKRADRISTPKPPAAIPRCG